MSHHAPKPPFIEAERTNGPKTAEAALRERTALRLNEVATTIGVSRRTIERERSAGRFPKPDRTIGRMPLWSPETIARWLEGGGRA